MDYWQDRITDEQHKKCATALKKFRKGAMNEHELYNILTHNGVTVEEADEIIELETGDIEET